MTLEELPNSPIRVLVLDDSSESGEVIANLLRGEPGFSVSYTPVAYGEGQRAARQSEPDAIILMGDHLIAADAVVTIQELESAAPHATVVVLASVTADRLREFILAGARDCLVPPYTREALVASVRTVHLNEIRRRERLAANLSDGLRRHRCQLIAFHGAKGGMGATTLAANVAVGLRQISGERIALLDTSLQAGDIGVVMNLNASTGIDDLMPHLNELDVELMNKVLVRHVSGVQVLLAPREVERADTIDADDLRRMLAFLAGHFDYLVVDTAPILDAAGLATLDQADKIVLVATPEVASLKNASRFMQLARQLGYPPTKVTLVINRAGQPYAVSTLEVEKRLGLKPIATVPHADRTFLHAASQGELVVSATALQGAGHSLYQLAGRLAVSTSKSQRSLLPRLSLPGSGIFRRRQARTPDMAGKSSMKTTTSSS